MILPRTSFLYLDPLVDRSRLVTLGSQRKFRMSSLPLGLKQAPYILSSKNKGLVSGSEDTSKYTSAVDLWSLESVVYQLLC